MSNVFGERVLVKKIFEKTTELEPVGKFNGLVKVLEIGEDFKQGTKRQVVVGDILKVAGTSDFGDETYVIDKQILRWEKAL